jgi:hypothetical protein
MTHQQIIKGVSPGLNPKNAFIGVGLFFENRQEAGKLGLLPPGKSFEAVCERLEPQERKERVFKGQPDIDDFNCIIWVNRRPWWSSATIIWGRTGCDGLGVPGYSSTAQSDA